MLYKDAETKQVVVFKGEKTPYIVSDKIANYEVAKDVFVPSLIAYVFNHYNEPSWSRIPNPKLEMEVI